MSHQEAVQLVRDRVVISGIGKSIIGRVLGRPAMDLTLDAGLAAIADAGLQPTDIDGLATYPGGSGPTAGVELHALHDALRLPLNWYASGGEVTGPLEGLGNAMIAIATGLVDHVLVYKTVVESTAQAEAKRLGASASSMVGAGGVNNIPGESRLMPWMLPYGSVSIVNWYAPHAQWYFDKYGATREQLAQIALNDRKNAALNESAVFRTPLTMDDYMSARMISTPLCLFDCDIPVDGSIAFVLSRKEHAKATPHAAIGFDSFATASDRRATWDQWDDPAEPYRASGKQLWSSTSLKPTDVDVVELYDGFSILVLLALEGLGFCGEGEAAQFIEGGHRIALDGELPVNTDGGQLSAHRFYGYGLLYESCLQLRTQAGQRQVANVDVVCTSNMLLTRAR